MRATIEGRVLPDIGSGRPVVELIREIRDGTVSGRSLDSESRRACVAYLGAEGYGVPEIAALLKVSDRTIARDRARVREDLAVERDPSLLPRTVGQLMAEAEASSVRLRRIARDRSTPAATRVEAEKATWGIVCDLVRLLQGLGYLPQAPRPIRASVRVGGLMGDEDDEFDAPALEELERELARIEAIAGGGASGGAGNSATGGEPEHHQEPNELAALRSDLGRLAVAARIAAVERLIATTTQGRDTDDQDEQQQQRRDESDERDERSEHQGRTRAPARTQAQPHERKAPARAASSLGSKGRSGTGRASRRRAG